MAADQVSCSVYDVNLIFKVRILLLLDSTCIRINSGTIVPVDLLHVHHQKFAFLFVQNLIKCKIGEFPHKNSKPAELTALLLRCGKSLQA